MMNDKTRIVLEVLITEREGMIAENAYAAIVGRTPTYGDKAFHELADKIHELYYEEEKPASPKRTTRIAMELLFIPVEERFPTEEHVVFVVTAEGSKPQRAYWQKKVVGCVESLAVNWLAWCDGVRINNVTHWAEVPVIKKL